MHRLMTVPGIIGGNQMAKVQVVEIRCDRCNRIEHDPDVSRAEKKEPDFSAKLLNKDTGEMDELKYEDLCTTCLRVVHNAWERIRHYDKAREEAEAAVVEGDLD